MKVKLLAYTQDAQTLVAAAAKLCYSASDIDLLMEKVSNEQVEGFINMLIDIGHESPLEHISFTFGIEGVSRALLAQLTRHRIASYSVQSQRYVSECEFEYIVPPEIEAVKEAKEEFLIAMEQANSHYMKLTNILTQKHIKQLVSEGKTEDQAQKLARKQAIEDARFVLPNACDTKLIMTMNVRSLFNFFAHRCCNRAQWEIHALADEMLRLVTEVCPVVFKKAGPPCLFASCPEGKMTCGKIKQVRQQYLKEAVE